MDKQKGWKIILFYRTLSPIGAAAKNNYAINMLSQTTLGVSRHNISHL